MEHTEFNFDKIPAVTKWTVEKLIPMGHLCIFLAQAGVGKSLLVEDLATHIVYGESFCGLDTIEGNVLLIDQDTPSDVINRRLVNFGKGISTNPPKHKLFLESMRGYSLHNGSLIRAINNYPSAKVIIIDCLHSVAQGMNPNATPDMGVLAKLKQECLVDDKTILMCHHISEKKDFTNEELMGGNPHSLSMGSSAVIQQADTYYVVGAHATNGVTDQMYLRAIPKRASIETKPLILKMMNSINDTGEKLEYFGYYEPELSEDERDIMTLFRERPSDRTIQEIYADTGHKISENSIRRALRDLEIKGSLIMNRHSHNQFKYRLPRKEELDD